MKRLLVVTLALVGAYVLGARSGQAGLEKLRSEANRLRRDPRVRNVQDAVTEAADTVTEKASDIADKASGAATDATHKFTSTVAASGDTDTPVGADAHH